MPTIKNIINDVTSSGCLGSSTRQVKLLEYLLTEAEENRQNRIKAYSVALDVLGRDESFDGSVDSIVRVEMHRLRKNLALYNSGHHAYQLLLPKGSYHITYQTDGADDLSKASGRNSEKFLSLPQAISSALGLILVTSLISFFMFQSYFSTNTALTSTCSATHPNVFIAPTNSHGRNKSAQMIPITIKNELQVGLAQYSKIHLIEKASACPPNKNTVYSVQTTLFNSISNPYVSVHVTHMASQTIIFTRRLQINDTNEFGELEKDTADLLRSQLYQISSQIAHATGVVPNDAIARQWQSPKNKSLYHCHISAAKSFVLRNLDENSNVEKCLEKFIANGDRTPDTLGLLATHYMYQVRGFATQTVDNPFEEAEKILKIAEQIAPNNPEVLLARLRMETEKPNRDIESIRHIINTIEYRQPYNFYMLQSTALHAAYKLGDWEFALGLSKRINKINYTRSKRVKYVELGYLFMLGTPVEAFELLEEIYTQSITIDNVYCVAIANKAKQFDQVKHCREVLRSRGYKTKDDIKKFVTDYNQEQSIQTELKKWIDYPPNP